ncbi:3-oxoacyl-[acyl-carrier-protein] synthase-3 [Paenibacillus cellulosilyticus]|uniref:3-oxoacyl-[acyl-carrier-protein] synthase-3 n=1 Tax=Paenibacillus cellulosilyticus TaxID=375489 RepID=A0A2V2Z210_9BACL|nr:ketoacyl-ACP synthase III [Paenibacillus cellulosilyticus]PWW08316.1 3-oxoacyl-[acyl-carrier-protein] synthase-3 [Paenibacillus cellulosilyticus]QKS47916.1 ketoacyl-ACP synthase III [Paenibacillus cellulosilyticus]
MKTVFKKKKITGILGVLPATEVSFEDEVSNYNFPEKQTMRLKKIMGFEKHRVVKDTTASSDLCVAGLNHLLEKKLIDKGEIGAIVVVTTTPDHFIPHVSNIIHGNCDLSNDVICMDLNQGCAGFLQGLMQSFMLLEHLGNKKVVLFNVDTLSKKVSKQDRNSYPLIGDAAGITVVENDPNARDIHFNMYNDGGRREALIIPAGGSRLPSSAETAVMRDLDQDGNLRSLDNLKMDGSEVFTFVQTEVPPLIEETLKLADQDKEHIDWFLFHQPNKFMLKKLAEKLEVPYEKVPMNVVENFGNPSGSSIPIDIVHNLGSLVMDNQYNCCLAAFGSGLAWGAMTIELGRMDFCEMLISDY